MVRVATGLVLVCLAATALTGCGGGEAKARNDLKQVGLSYLSYHDQYQKGPANWDEFIKFTKDAQLDAAAVQRVRDAGYQLQWDIKLSELKKGSSETVLAEKPGGGMKLYCDGSVQGQ